MGSLGRLFLLLHWVQVGFDFHAVDIVHIWRQTLVSARLQIARLFERVRVLFWNMVRSVDLLPSIIP